MKIENYPKTETLQVIDTIGVPHPYCITAKHVSYTSDYHQGMLDKDAIEDCEKHGIKCGVKGCQLDYHEHGQALLIEVDSDKEIKDVEGLKEYLLSINEQCIEDGYEGYAFIKKS